jgi:hypothetical protein
MAQWKASSPVLRWRRMSRWWRGLAVASQAQAFFDLADAIITVRSLIRQAWTAYRWDGRPPRRP